jgi:hypothetical protein
MYSQASAGLVSCTGTSVPEGHRKLYNDVIHRILRPPLQAIAAHLALQLLLNLAARSWLGAQFLLSDLVLTS